MRLTDILVAVMSYNRGHYLENCLQSIAESAPTAQVVVFDVGSSDPATLEVLHRANRRLRVVNREQRRNEGLRDETGGLARNMNAAVDLAHTEGYQYLWLIQEDMQLVREVDTDFLADCAVAFAAHANVVQLRPGFMNSAMISDHTVDNFLPDLFARCYLPRGGPNGIQDTGILRVGAIIEAGVSFVPDERTMFALGAHHGWVRAYVWNPVVAFLPWPSTKHENLSGIQRFMHRASESYFRTGVHRLVTMTEQDVERLKRRPSGELPYAESFLKTMPGDKVPRPWWYERASLNPRQRVKRALRRVI